MDNKYIMLSAYLNNNLGDDLFIHILTNRYSNYKFYVCSDHKHKALSGLRLCESFWFYPLNRLHSILNRRRINCSIISKIYKKQLYNLIRRSICCINIIGSGFIEKKGLIQDKEFDELFYTKKTYIIGCNFGPYSSESYYSRYKKLFEKVADVCFRESYSKELFAPLKLRCESDIVFCYNLGEELPQSLSNRSYVVFSVIQLQNHFNSDAEVRDYKEFLVDSMLYWSEQRKDIVIVAFCKSEGDLTAALEIKSIAKSRSNNIVIEIFAYPDFSYTEMMGIIKNSDLIIATRYHAMIIGFLYKKLVYPIVYSDKEVHVIHDIFGEISIAYANNLKNIGLCNFFENYGLLLSSERYMECVNSANRQFERLDKLLLNKQKK